MIRETGRGLKQDSNKNSCVNENIFARFPIPQHESSEDTFQNDIFVCLSEMLYNFLKCAWLSWSHNCQRRKGPGSQSNLMFLKLC